MSKEKKELRDMNEKELKAELRKIRLMKEIKKEKAEDNAINKFLDAVLFQKGVKRGVKK